MIIAINTRLLLKDRMEGIGRFSFEILKRITTKHKEHTFIFFFDRPFDKSFIFSANIIPVILFPQARHPFLWYWYFEFSIPMALKKYKADLFITTDGWLSLKTEIKTMQVLHDLHYEKYPEYLPYLTRKYYQYFFPKFVRKATRIITVSDFCKTEIIAAYKIPTNNIDVVYNSTREEYHPLSLNETSMVKQTYTGGLPYFLFIGPIHPRKNLDTAIKAFIQYKRITKDKTKLVITGSEMWKGFGNLRKNAAYLDNKDIVFTGYLSPEKLLNITGSASCLLYVSFYEGFGIPILEAMSCHVPVITSNKAAMPEIAGDATILVNPNSVDEISAALLKIQTNHQFKEELIIKGRNNLKRFSWDRSAIAFWDSIVKALP